MAQGILPFKYELERSEAGMTALAGLPLYLDLAKVVGLSRSIQRHLRVRDNGQGCPELKRFCHWSCFDFRGKVSVWVFATSIAIEREVATLQGFKFLGHLERV